MLTQIPFTGTLMGPVNQVLYWEPRLRKRLQVLDKFEKPSSPGLLSCLVMMEFAMRCYQKARNDFHHSFLFTKHLPRRLFLHSSV